MFGTTGSAVIITVCTGVLLIGVIAAVIFIRARKKRAKREEDMIKRESDLVKALSNPMAVKVRKTGKTVIPKMNILITRCDIPNQRGYRYKLGDRIRIGRSEEYNNLIIAEETVSGRHCEIFERDGEFCIIDIQSANQTVIFRGGEWIVVDSGSGTTLENGDRIHLGNADFLIRLLTE